MNKIDTIIDVLEIAANEVESAYVASHIEEALAAARELQVINANLLEALKTLIDMDVAYQRGDKVEQAVEAVKAAITKAEVTK